MVRFKKFLEKKIIFGNLKNSGRLLGFGVAATYVPDVPDEFDEFSFAADYGERAVSIGIAVLDGKIKRLMVGFADPEDPDIITALSKEELADFLNQKGEKLVQFFEYITQ